jgi:WD40 repeat protein
VTRALFLSFVASLLAWVPVHAADPDPAQVATYGYLRHVAYAPNGQSVAVATARAVEIWDAALGKLLQTYPLEPAATRMRLAWSPDSRSLALNTQQRIIVWEGGVGTAPKEMQFDDSLRIPPSMFPSSPPSVEWSPQGDRLAFLTVSGLISQGTMVVERDSPVWHLPPMPKGLDRPPPPKIHRGGQYEIAWSPDGSQLAAITEHTVEVWSAISGVQIRAANLPEDHAVRERKQQKWPLVAWSPAGAKLATCDRMNFVQVWDAATGDLLLQLDGGNSTHATLVWSRKGDRLALATEEAVTVWDATSGARVLQTQNGVIGNFASFSPDLDRGVIATLAGQMEIWPPLDARQSNSQGTADVTPHYAAWAPGDRLAVWTASGNLRVFDLARRSVTLETQASIWGRQSIAWSSNGEALAVPEADGVISLHIDSASTMGIAPAFFAPPGFQASRKLNGAKPPIYAMDFMPSQPTLAALGGDSLWIWDLAKGDTPQRFPVSGTELVWTSDHTILIAGFDGSLTEFDLATGKPGWTFSPPDQPYPEPAHLSPGGLYFSANRTMWRRNKEGPPEISVRSLTATPYWTADGKAFTTTPELRFESQLAIQESTTGKRIAGLPFQRRVLGTMSGLVWSPDGLSLALTTMDGSAYVQRLRLQARD